MPDINLDFSLHPKAAYDYLDAKGYKLSYDYAELDGKAHQKSFTAAKVTRLDLLQDIHHSLLAAQTAGTPFKAWLNDLKPTLQKKGWWGEKDIIDPKTGEVKTVYIGSRRLKHIYDTNMRVAYNAGRYQKQRKLTKAVYWRYVSLLLPKSRNTHTALHGTVLHRDNAFWSNNYPLNGHGCKCKVTAYTAAQVRSRKMTITEDAPNTIAHPDWAYDMSNGSRTGSISTVKFDGSVNAIKPNKTLAKLTDAQLKNHVYQLLAIKSGGMYVDKVNDPISIDDTLLTTTLALKDDSAKKHPKSNPRATHIDALANALTDPDKIYLGFDQAAVTDPPLIKKMVRYFTAADKRINAFVALFMYQPDKTVGVEAYVMDEDTLKESTRTDRLIYQKAQTSPKDTEN